MKKALFSVVTWLLILANTVVFADVAKYTVTKKDDTLIVSGSVERIAGETQNLAIEVVKDTSDFYSGISEGDIVYIGQKNLQKDETKFSFAFPTDGSSYNVKIDGDKFKNSEIFAVDYATAAEHNDTLLFLDFDTVSYISQQLQNSAAVCDIHDGYLEISTKWANAGYPLERAITSDNCDYTLEFDFKMTSNSSGGYPIMLSEALTEFGSSEPYAQFGVLGVNSSNRFIIAGVEMDGMLWDADKWYEYKLSFNPATTEVDVTITDKQNSRYQASFKGAVGDRAYYGSGMPHRNYDTLKFTYNSTILLDNINLAVKQEEPIFAAVTSTHVGNVFDSSDEKTLNASFENALLEGVETEISYKVYDDMGNETDSGDLGALSFAKTEKKEVPITVDASKYGTYEIVFDICATYGNDRVTYSTEGYKFSIVNKRADGEALNPKSAVNTEYVYSIKEWNKLEEMLLQAGISSFRKDLTWSEIEAEKGVYKNPSQTSYYQNAKDAGLGNMVIINGKTSVYSDTGASQWADAIDTIEGVDGVNNGWEAWQKYIKYVCEQFDDSIEYYEILNESNESISAYLYTDYLKIARDVIKAHNPNAKVVGVVSASTPWWWIEEVLSRISSNPTRYLDAISIHPYDFAAEDGSDGYLTTADGLHWGVKMRDSVITEKLQKLHSYMDEYNCSDIPVLLTEMAISSTPGLCSIRMQAAELTQLYTTAHMLGLSDKIYWYSFENTREHGEADFSEISTEDNFGIISSRNDPVPFAAKPAYVAMAGYNKMLTGATYQDKLEKGNTKVYRFTKNGEQIIVMWAEETAESISLSLGTSSIEVFDLYTNKVADMSASDGIYTLSAGPEPLFIKGSFTTLKAAESIITMTGGMTNLGIGDEATVTINDTKGRNLTLSTVASSNLEVNAPASLTSGAASIDIRSLGGKAEEAVLDIKLLDGSNVVFYGRAYAPVQELNAKGLLQDGSEVSGYLDIPYETSSTVSIDLRAENVAADGANAEVAVVYYDYEGKMQKAEVSTAKVTERGKSTVDLTLTPPTDCYNIKIMLIKDGEFIPYSKAINCYIGS